MKHYITGIVILATHLVYGAADEPLTVEKLIGMACSSRGKLSCVTSLTPNPKPSCSITLAYSEHPALKEKDVLNSITQQLSEMDIQNNYESYIKFITFCKEETTKQVATELSHNQSSDATIVSPNSYNLIALCSHLGLESYQYNGYFQHNGVEEGTRAGGSYSLWEVMPRNNQLPMHLVADHYIPLASEEVVADPQLKAEDLHEQKPKSPFHLVIKLDAWRSYIEPIREQIEDEDKNKMVLKSDKKKSCSVQ